MSTRQLRKLQKQREMEAKAAQESEGSDDGDASDEEIAPVVAKPRANLFAALGGGEEAEGETEEDDDAEESQGQGEGVKASDAHAEEPSAPAANRKNKHKKKKKKKKKNMNMNMKAKTTAPARDGEHSEDDEIDRAIKDLKIEPRPLESSAPGSASAYDDLLKVNLYHLKADHEMRNLFGRETIESINAEEEEQRRAGRRGAILQHADLETFLRAPPNARKLPEVSRRRNILIQGKEYWPMGTTGGLSMRELGKTPDGTGVEFAYAHDREYDGVQILFFERVQMGDPMGMVRLLVQFPYHVSTILQVSSVAKQDQNMALAAELCERALFSFGRVAPSSFKQALELGKARMDFRRPENRQFWLAGYHYIKSLTRKGTYRTALEWAKLLYALDRGDPYAMRHLIHVLAIRAHESSWLLDFLGQLDAQGGRDDTVYLLQSRVPATLQMGDADQARQHLVDGMQRVPWLYCALFRELNLDTPPSIWGVEAETRATMFWAKLYLYQAKDLWNSPQARALLQDVAKSIARVDAKPPPKDSVSIDVGVARLAYMDGQAPLLALVPQHILCQQPNYDFDPLPPAEEDNIFTAEGCRLPYLEQQNYGRREQGRLGEVVARMGELLDQGPVPELPDELADEILEQLRNGDLGGDWRGDGDDAGVPEPAPDEVPASSEDRGILRALVELFGFGRARGGGSVTEGEGGEEDENEEDSDEDSDDSEDSEDSEDGGYAEHVEQPGEQPGR
ncbi:hypothetical protein Trco_006599 [Trichoderma cornu-damae]|uniref:DUF654-domain-containing protein n=1 Tax=Trichoderma cornu-damae TaxID=654480 RepID=A0A9P8QLT0_9HYPO|nr:hypothetical protein Trco_006599 [Trichoderma cornu-damae]